jgi:outer membrane murein-binding lipoprotein Lpp
MHTAPGLFQPSAPGGGRRLLALLMTLVFLSACAPADKSDKELRKEVQALKAQMAAMQEKLNQVQADEQAILALLKKAAPPAEPLGMPSQPPAAESLTVDQLLASKDRYLGARVKLKGMVGPVMVHHKSLMLKSPKGMVEVRFGNLPDPKIVQRLTSTTLDKPITVTGVVNLAPSHGTGALFQINAEAVEF